jgi:hypothetical protein
MAVRVQFKRTELSEGVIKTFEEVDTFVILDDNTVELRKNTKPGKYRVVGFLHPKNRESIIQVEERV